MATRKIIDVFSAAAIVGSFGVLVAGAVVHDLRRSDELEHLRLDNDRLREELSRRATGPVPVAVTCECPDYEEGWDDAEFVEGCDPEPLDVETLETVCGELDAYGYVPRC